MLNLFKSKKNGVIMSHLNNLVSVALADGTLDESEWEMLCDIAVAKGFDASKLDEVRENAGKIDFVPPATHREKIQQIYELVEIMIADGDIDERELEICRKLAEKLNIHPRIITDMLSKLPEWIRRELDPIQIVDDLCVMTQ